MTILIETNDITIREFASKDLPAFAHYRNIPEVAKYQSWTDYSLDEAKSLYDNLQTYDFGKTGTWYQLVIASRENDQIVGDFGIHFIDNEQVEMGITLSPQFQGKDIAKPAVIEMLKHLFGSMKKHRVIAITDVENTPANKLLNKLGFRQEGHYIDNIFFKGAWGSEYSFAMLASEFTKS